MIANVDFQMECENCGFLGVKIENPEGAAREAAVYCGECGLIRGTVGAHRDLALRPGARSMPSVDREKVETCSELVALHKALQDLRRKVKVAEARQKS